MKNSKIILGGSIASLFLVLFLSFSAFLPETVAEDISQQDSTPKQDVAFQVSEEPFNVEVLSLTEIFEKTEKGVVSITVQKLSNLNPSVGSGFVFDKQGHIITNNHVVENTQKLVVTFTDGTSYNAKIVGTDPYADIAVIKIDADNNKLNPIPIGDSTVLKVGQKVAAIGNPFGLSGSMTSGIVSQLGRLLSSQETGFSIADVIQTDAAINPGNSGGPLLNMKGEVIGINTAIYSSGGDFAGVGLSIPSKILSKIVPSLIEFGEYKHSWIGITTVNVNPDLADILQLDDAKGVQIMTIVKESPADKAGLKGSSQTVTKEGVEYRVGGDVILSIDENDVRKIDDILIYLQRETSPGDEIVLGILRDGNSMNLTVKLDQRPDSN